MRTNADTPEDAKAARAFGAEGIGLCRTEHMFFEGDRIRAVREMILADDEAGRRKALAKLLPMQRGDFEGIFRAMDGLPVTIRLLDPPLHEFLPHDEANQKIMAHEMNVPLGVIKMRVDDLHEFNPMLGHRGCRLGITYPEITEMQMRAIFEAAAEHEGAGHRRPARDHDPAGRHGPRAQRAGEGHPRDRGDGVRRARRRDRVPARHDDRDAARRADRRQHRRAGAVLLVRHQRPDADDASASPATTPAGSCPPTSKDGILERDPFQTIDQNGVGQLMQMAVQKGRSARPGLKLGICGEHGGDPASIEFCHKVGLNYVSCSPFRVPIARLAAAQAALDDAK